MPDRPSEERGPLIRPVHGIFHRPGMRPTRGLLRTAVLAAALAGAAACGGNPKGVPIRVTVPPRAGLATAADSLAAHGIIGSTAMFKLYGRVNGGGKGIKPGIYEFRRGDAFADIVRRLERGDVVKIRWVIPEGWTLPQVAARLAKQTGLPPDSVLRVLADPTAPAKYGVPGPTLEGYLYPATYVYPLGTPLPKLIGAMTDRYRAAWTPAMRAKLAESGMSERDAVALASIVEKEAKVWTERPVISAVYHNRLTVGMRLQADPTVQYALGRHTARLLYGEIRDVAGNPYNTYTHAGLPPGPIASPSKGAIEAALNPSADDYLYFVARSNGTHVFTRSLAEHNTAKLAAKRETAAAAQATPP
ncbi:MAG: aminodeoxychorismate lyase [Gemmatimonadetes bacterium]|nr:aminodeoxychorismate lyase [Gemmatimonadota bacterium]